MSITTQKSKGFSMVELSIVCAILVIVLGGVFTIISQVAQRSQAEQVKIDLTQSGRAFVDEFQRDLHQAGYPNCRLIATPGAATNCPPDYTNLLVAQNSAVAAGLVDQDNNYPPATNCPCTLQRSQMPKVNGILPLAQPTTFSQELQNVVNSGVVAGTAPYGTGLVISGNTAWGASNTAYYAAITTFKDYPVFTAYDQNGTPVALPLDLSTTAGQSNIPNIKSIRLTINLLASSVTGIDAKTNVRPVETLVGNVRLVNCGGQPCD